MKKGDVVKLKRPSRPYEVELRYNVVDVCADGMHIQIQESGSPVVWQVHATEYVKVA